MNCKIELLTLAQWCRNTEYNP